MRVEKRGDRWAVRDGERVHMFPTNAAAWRFIDRAQGEDDEGRRLEIAAAFTAKHF